MKVGVEVELTDSKENRPTYREAGEYSEYVLQRYRDNIDNWPDADVTYDGTVGTEVIMDRPWDIDNDPGGWFSQTLSHAEREYGCVYEPCGLMDGRHASTAGLHIHLSPLSREQAEQLYSMSQQPWMQVFVCSSVTEERAPVLRGNSYCTMDGDVDNYDRYTAVRAVQESQGHYEWRMPEPMGERHFEMVIEFLRRFQNSPSEAEEYARDIVNSADRNLTAVQRAEEVDLVGQFESGQFYNISRSPFPKSDDFFWSVLDESSTPYILRAYDGDEQYYAFYSTSFTTGDEFEIDGIEFSIDEVLDARSLKPVRDEAVREDVHSSVQEHMSSDDEPNRTDATEKLLEVMQ